MFNKKFLIFLISCFFCSAIYLGDKNNQDLEYKQLQKNISEKCNSLKTGLIGVSAYHIESKKWVNCNADEFYPMASTYKLQIAAYCLSLVDKKQINLQEKYKIKTLDLQRGSTIKKGQQMSIAELIKLMIEKSKNDASDIILRMVGGPDHVNNWLKTNGFNNMSVDRSVLEMLDNYHGVNSVNSRKLHSINQDIKLINSVTVQNRSKALQKFYVDKKDTTTPKEMVNFLTQLFEKKLLSEDSTNFLLQSMLKCHWGKEKIPGLLPQGTKIWHKTGRMDKITSDVGIVELPKNKGHLVIALYTNKSKSSIDIQERKMAQISKLLFDYFSK
ncbi:MAG: Beta-lactamase [candidate division TM6 bacterium GW2011_GWF2_28_16]|nr:MAG: Beta-lactamase [candidate division TM6 bacterium GW2011_GWF2_28_16]